MFLDLEEFEAHVERSRDRSRMSGSDVPAEKLEWRYVYGPKELPGTGHGTITSAQRTIIKKATNCDAATRTRVEWPARMLTLYGPKGTLKSARVMADTFILDRAHRNHNNHEKRINQHKFNKIYIYTHKLEMNARAYITVT